MEFGLVSNCRVDQKIDNYNRQTLTIYHLYGTPY